MFLPVCAWFRVHLAFNLFSVPLEVFPVPSGFASLRFREVDSTSLPFVHKLILRKMRFQSHFVLPELEPQAHSARGGPAPQRDRLVEGRQCPLPAPSCADP